MAQRIDQDRLRSAADYVDAAATQYPSHDAVQVLREALHRPLDAGARGTHRPDESALCPLRAGSARGHVSRSSRSESSASSGCHVLNCRAAGPSRRRGCSLAFRGLQVRLQH